VGLISSEPLSQEEGDPDRDGAPREAVSAQAYGEQGGEDATDEAGGTTIRGHLSSRGRFRWNDDEDDHDLFAVAHAVITTGGEDPYRFEFTGRAAWDTDGNSSGSPFFGIDDTYDGELQGRLYKASVDVPLGQRIALARLGRQILWESPVTLHFDGVRLETEPMGLPMFVLGAYGGIPVHLYESSSRGDDLVGAYAALSPWERGRLRLDWMHIGDETRFSDVQNDLLAASLRHDFELGLQLEGDYTLLESESRDATVRARWIHEEWGTRLRFSHYRLFEAQTDLVNELNPYFNTLGTFYPYDQTRFEASQPIGEHLELFGGVDFRRVDDEGDIGRYNRDYDRYYLSGALAEFLDDSLTLSVTGEIWDSPGQDIDTWGVDLTSEINEETRAAIGSYFSLYKYYLDLDLERDNVRTYFAELRRELSETLMASIRYEFEDEELDELHTLRVGMTWRF
jgi:hypothetical protein